MSTMDNMTQQSRNDFLQEAYPVCHQCFGTQIVKDSRFKKSVNKQKEIYQRQHFSHRMIKICACVESELL